MRPLGFLCRLTLVRRGCVHKNAAVQCSSAAPGYPPSPGLALFTQVRGRGILRTSSDGVLRSSPVGNFCEVRENHLFGVRAPALLGTIIWVSLSRAPLIPLLAGMYVRKIMLRVPSGVIRLIDFDARGDVRVVELGGLAYVVLHLFGDLVARIDGLHRALWHAHGAVDALGGVDHELVIGVVDAVHWARPYAGRVLRADTQFGNNIGHALPLCSVGRLLHASIIPARSLPPTRAALRVGKRSVKDIRFSGLIHRSAWNKNSANFAFWGFSEVRIHGVLGSSYSPGPVRDSFLCRVLGVSSPSSGSRVGGASLVAMR